MHAQLNLPQYLPDATFGQVRGLSAEATAACGIQAVVMNTFHLMQKPGASTVKSLGGLHRMSGWDKAIFTDSGGFQAYSLIRQDARFGQFTENGLAFKTPDGDRKYQLTPEKCIQLQLGFDSDLLFCLDDCTHIDDDQTQQETSVERTIRWAKRCRVEFDRLLDEKRLPEEKRPKLFGVVQGGNSPELRRRCAEALLEIGFRRLRLRRLAAGQPEPTGRGNDLPATRPDPGAIPTARPWASATRPTWPAVPRTATACSTAPCPRADARHGRLYRFSHIPSPGALALNDDWFEYVYAHDKRHIKSSQPVEEGCDCPLCSSYSLGYLRHLFKLNDTLYLQLATQHNLRFMTRLMDLMRLDLP